MQQSFAGNWVILHYGTWGSSEKNIKDNMTVSNHVDKNFRAHMDALKTTALPSIPDHIVANQFFASLPQDLKNVIIDKSAVPISKMEPGHFYARASPKFSKWQPFPKLHLSTFKTKSATRSSHAFPRSELRFLAFRRRTHKYPKIVILVQLATVRSVSRAMIII
jgi:hypothetical protein